jgi:phage major head subunit gpT-like protein
MREWLGDKVWKNVRAGKYTLTIQDYEDSFKVPKHVIEDDTYNLYEPRFSAMGEAARLHEDQMVWQALSNGFTTLGPDGQYYFDTDHEGSSNQSNKGTGALTATTYKAARVAMRKYTDINGNILNITPTHLVVPPDLEGKALELLNADLVSSTSNVWKGSVSLIINPHLSTTTEWYLLDLSKSIKPVIYANRKDPVFLAATDPEDAEVISTGEFKYSVEARRTVGYAFWQLAYGSTGAS